MISLPLNNPVAFILSSCFRFLKKKSQQLRCLVAIFSIPFSTVFTRSNAMKSAIHIVKKFVIWKKRITFLVYWFFYFRLNGKRVCKSELTSHQRRQQKRHTCNIKLMLVFRLKRKFDLRIIRSSGIKDEQNFKRKTI